MEGPKRSQPAKAVQTGKKRRRGDRTSCPEGRAALEAIGALASALRPSRAPDFKSLPAEGIDLKLHLEAVGRGLMQEALDRCAGVQTKAAKLLRMSFRTFRYYRKKYDLVLAALPRAREEARGLAHEARGAAGAE